MENTKGITSITPEEYKARKQKRIESLKKRAEKAEQRHEELYSKAKEMSSRIVFGQPILVGHHSEGRDRRFRGKIEKTFSRSFEELDKKAYYEDRAKSAENNKAISSDDPEVIAKLEAKLTGMIKNNETMKAANKYFKKNGHLDGFDDLSDHIKKEAINQWNKYKMGSLFGLDTANIRSVKKRLELLKKRAEQAKDGNKERSFSWGSVVINYDVNRVQFILNESPDSNVKQILKGHGFRWAPSMSAWQRKISGNAYYSAKGVIKEMEELSPCQ